MSCTKPAIWSSDVPRPFFSQDRRRLQAMIEQVVVRRRIQRHIEACAVAQHIEDLVQRGGDHVLRGAQRFVWTWHGAPINKTE